MSKEADSAVLAFETELARRLSAAYVSTQLQLSLPYAYNRYAKDQPVGEYWLHLARRVIAEQSQGVESPQFH